MADKEIIAVIAGAIADANRNDPYSDKGTIRDAIQEGTEKSAFLAKTVGDAINRAGFQIVKKESA